MKSYWIYQAKNADINEMFQDENAAKIQLKEQPEVLGLLPDLTGKRVLELASGIGRFTGHLAERAKHVTTVDFIEKYIAKNREQNQHLTNITFIVDDVMNLSFDKDSFDIVFSNWILEYLNVDDIKRLLQRLLHWLTDDSSIFFRESCYRPMGNFDRPWNPTIYRVPSVLNRLFREVCLREREDEKSCHLEIVFARHLLSVVKLTGHRGTICWHLHKSQGLVKRATSDQENASKVAEAGLSQAVISQRVTEEQIHVKKLELQPGQIVLHVGCGDGQLDFHMESEYGVRVHGIDPSCEMIEAAWDRKGMEKDSKICFEIGDIQKRQFPSEFFDAIYMARSSSDSRDERRAMENFATWLKPLGKLLVCYLCDKDTAPFSIAEIAEVFPDSLRVMYHQHDGLQIWSIAEKRHLDAQDCSESSLGDFVVSVHNACHITIP